MILASFNWDAVWETALAVFLLLVGLGIGYAFWRLGSTFASVSSLVQGTEREVLPVVNKVGGTVDRVNHQLDKVDLMTDSAVDAVDSVDTAVRAVSLAVTKPVEAVAGFAAGVSHGFSAFRDSRDVRASVKAGREAAQRRVKDLDEELREHDDRRMDDA